MLGTVATAKDVVQDAYLWWHVVDGRIQDVYTVLNPEKLRHITAADLSRT